MGLIAFRDFDFEVRYERTLLATVFKTRIPAAQFE
jgi:hypothetical protein